MNQIGSDIECRLRAIEAAFKHERQQRDMIEKKYARLKRRYVRLERSHSRLLIESHGKKTDRVNPLSTQSETSSNIIVESTLNLRSSASAVIDLTSPRPGTNAASSSSHNNTGLERSLSREMQPLELGFLSRDDICGESPRSSFGSSVASTRRSCGSGEQEEKKMEEEEETVARESWRCDSNRLYSTSAPRRRLHLGTTLSLGLTESHRPLISPTRRMQQLYGLQSDYSTSSHSSPQSAHSMTTHSGEPCSRTRPRLHLHDHSTEQTAAAAYGYELEQELEPRAHRHERYRWASDLSPEPSTPSIVVSSSLVTANSSSLLPTAPLPASRPRAPSNEEASIALAQYLQQQENIAAYEEYEARFLRESVEHDYHQQSHQSTSSLLSSLGDHQRNIDPDNMTYEELLRLGEEVGDVKKERWREMAAQVLSSLPIHHWTRGHGEDTCIICQYNFMLNDRAMTLPCAHVFHKDCVGGWICENNSCPLCKREIAPMSTNSRG